MNFNELKKKSLEWLKNNPEYKLRLTEELAKAKIAYDNDIDLVDELKKLKEEDNLSDGYLLPAVLGLTELTELKPIELKQVKNGDGGGLDIDTDISSAGKPLVHQYLEEKYGKDHVLSVGTFTTIGMASAIKDILRKEKVPFTVSNKFCSELNNELTFEQNMENYKNSFPELYGIYLQHKAYLDFVPYLGNVERGIGKHAGGCLILDKPIYECIPVVRVQGEIASAYTESGSKQELDQLGYIKYDLLAISQLDIIDDSLDMAEKDGFYKIEDDDGIIKIVSKAYLLEKGIPEEEIEKIAG